MIFDTKVVLFAIMLPILVAQKNPETELDRIAPYYSTFKSVECKNVDINGTGYFRNCFIKVYSRTYVTLNFGYKFDKPLKKQLHIRGILSFRYGTIYRQKKGLG